MTSDEPLHDLAAAFALDALDDDERDAFEEHLETCGACQTAVADYRAVALSLAEEEHTSPPASLKAAVMDSIDGVTQEPAPSGQRSTTAEVVDLAARRPGRSRALLAAAAAFVLLAVGALTVLQRSETSATTEVVDAPDAIALDLATTDDAQPGTLRVVWSDELDKVAIIGEGLDDPGAGKTYELWFLVEDGVAPAALFVPEDGDISAVFDVAEIDGQGWGVTIEPESGSDQPTSPVLFAGTI